MSLKIETCANSKRRCPRVCAWCLATPLWVRSWKKKLQQDSTPAWTQEAYRPPHSKYSFCSPIWGEGSTLSLVRGYPIPGWVIPHLWPEGGGGANLSLVEVPHPGVLLEVTWDQSLGYPWKGHGTSGIIMGWRWLPPGRDLGPVTGVPPGKDMGPVEVVWDGDGIPPMWTDLWTTFP